MKARLAGDDAGGRWGPPEHLLASIQELLSVIRIEARAIAGDKRPPAFTPIERPGAAAAREARNADDRRRADERLKRRTTRAKEAP